MENVRDNMNHVEKSPGESGPMEGENSIIDGVDPLLNYLGPGNDGFDFVEFQ